VRSRLFERWTVVAALSLVVVLVPASASATASFPLSAGQGADAPVRPADVRQHLAALQRIADRNDGNRSAGTTGYDASARYVASRMRAAGYRVRLQEFSFAFVVDRSPPSLRAVDAPAWSFRSGRDYATLGYSGSGRVEARVAAVDLSVPSRGPNSSTSACEAADFAAFPRGAVALVQRGTCTFREKVANAVVGGASAVVVFNEGSGGRREVFTGTLGPPQVRVPVLGASFAVGDTLRNGVLAGPTGITVVVRADMIAERRRTSNVIAESRSGTPDNVVVVGAHLDSVSRGPGINDNGSGSALVLEAAERMAAVRPRNRLRFVWWGAEEQGLLGSAHYVEGLTRVARRGIALYLNFDMVGSPNFVRFVYDGDNSTSARRSPFPAGSAAIERVFTRYLSARGLDHRETGMGGSDHLSFARAGIPVGGLFTGASDRKSDEQATDFGGRAGRPYDPCYHEPCDTIANVSARALAESAQAAVHAIRLFARDTTSVGRAR
jgi:Zn-dependent M28 family amino/carboxypeptidase